MYESFIQNPVKQQRKDYGPEHKLKIMDLPLELIAISELFLLL